MTKEKKTEERPAEKKAFSARALLPYLLWIREQNIGRSIICSCSGRFR